MYTLLALLTGVVIAVMISINGNLTESVGPYFSVVVIHIVGTVFAAGLSKLKREKIFKKHDVPLWAYLGGVFGVVTTFFNNYAFVRISMTSIIAIGLLGQSVTALFTDGFGLFGMQKHKIKVSTWIGIAISLVGVAVMLDASIEEEIIAVLVSFATGISVILSRTVNSRLSEKAGAITGSFYNHLVGLPICIVLWLTIADMPFKSIVMPELWMLGGGLFGVFVVILYNITVPKLPASRLTLISFLGQVFTGFAIDLINGQDISGSLFKGSLICSFGFLASMLIELWLNRTIR